MPTFWINSGRPGFKSLGLALMIGISGCASGPREKDLLPDEGPTTLETYERHLSGQQAPRHDEGRKHRTQPEDAVRTDAGAGTSDVAPPEEDPVDTRGGGVPVIPIGWSGEAIVATADANSQGGLAALGSLQQDFQRLPNPEILGYVYPHVRGDLPVPGYYTAFPLREGLYYARPGEGVYSGVGP